MKKLPAVSFLLAMFTSVAFAQPKSPGKDPKAPDAAKPADKPAHTLDVMAEAPKPPKEVADMAKMLKGTWKCTGKASMGGKTTDYTGTTTNKLDLDDWWITTSHSGAAGKMVYKFTSLTTYDPAGKKWHRMGADNVGAARQQESAGLTNGKIVWEGTGMMMGKTVKLRETEELAKDGKSFRALGESSTDGTTWTMGHDVNCKL